MVKITDLKKEPVELSEIRAPCTHDPHFIRTNDAFIRTNAVPVRTNDAFMSMSASLMRTNAALILVSQLTCPLSNDPLISTSDALVSTNASLALASHLIESQMPRYCHCCQHQLSSRESITGKIPENKEKLRPKSYCVTTS